MRVTAIQQGEFVTTEVDMPVPGSGQVLVRNLACGICGSDLHIFNMISRSMANQVNQEKQAGAPLASEEGGMPDLILGHEYCSEIVDFGPDTNQKLEVGQRVCSIPFLQTEEGQDPIGVTPVTPGAYSEYMLLSENYLLAVPDNTPTEAAALAEPLAVGLHAVERGSLSGKEPVLVMGCGPIGLAVIAILNMRGFKDIVASDYSAQRRELATAMGASCVIDPSMNSPFENLNENVNGSESQGVIFECIGAPGLLELICTEAPVNAKVIIAGLCTEEDKFNPFIAMQKELNIQYVFYYQPEEFAEALSILSKDSVLWRPFITGKVGLEGIAGAFESLKSPDAHAKILIDPWQSGDDIVSVSL